MSPSAPVYPTLDEWIASCAIPFSLDAPETLNAAVDEMVAALGDSVELLGFGEALHGGEEILILRNRLFARLATAHGYSAIALESSFPKASVVNEYVSGRGPASYDEVQEEGFAHGFGRLEANRELVEWMRGYNADPAHPIQLRFYGFDIPTAPTGNASPRGVLGFVLDYLSSVDRSSGEAYRQRIEWLLGQDFDWENPEQYADPAKRVGRSPAANALRLEVEDLISELYTRRPEFIAKSDAERYAEALHYARMARQHLNYHAAYARDVGHGPLLGIRDALMADNLAYIVGLERGRGKVLAFAHNSHLKRGLMTIWPSWQKALGSREVSWWPAGSHLAQMLGSRYAVIGSAVGVSQANGIGEPEVGTLESLLTASPVKGRQTPGYTDTQGSARFIPTHRGQGLPSQEIARLPTRSDSAKNLSYVPLSPQSFTDFDGFVVLDSTTYSRGGPPLP